MQSNLTWVLTLLLAVHFRAICTLAAEDDHYKLCNLVAEVGPCEAKIRRYFFDVRSGSCEPFFYGGCQGNANNFKTKAACESRCGYLEVEPTIPNICEEPKDSGPCKLKQLRFFYDSDSGQCRSFYYGGCYGNNNNFLTKLECQQSCTDVCHLPKPVRKCKGAFARYYFNTATEKCEKFTFDGCSSNGNNFYTKSGCEERCMANAEQVPDMDVCLKPKVKGPCRGHMKRFYFDNRRGRCVPFIYSGCQGNENNFLTIDECRLQCLRKSSSEEV